ncbi:hypothetical protein M2152_002674 [Microbacteriaceae bacterium SG_E_30_P1]|uniref:Septum formation-related domain-containing protein n=1 Tax=Antiquaquibacter oligotrophicus TaxID=2880260 RepID=A0ABT6KTH0_9MICO|nr:hypothetical protein [Antiquaquibacter oligotrophicus]MDH6182492.1 hypothetical protein [Antiquaquibacter oligotrophicus]UDF14539.1 hypothetical protein LH407_06665 [Antiquaquibacter oligotrophicus]
MTSDKDKPEGEEPVDGSDWLASQFETTSIPVSDASPPAPESTSEPAPPPPLIPPAVVSSPPTTPIVPPTTESLGVPTSQFSWGLTPPQEPPPEVPDAPAPEQPAAPEPAVPPASAPPPPDATLPGTPNPPAEPPPTEAMPVYDVPTQAMPSQELEPRPWEPWQARPIDPALEGITEVIEAELIGLDGPEGESNPQTPIDDLFGDGQFQEYTEVRGTPPTAPPPPARPSQWAPLEKHQMTLLWVAGGLVAVLALVALFLLGQRLGGTPTAEPTPTPTPTSTPTPTAPPIGPLPPGTYAWDELLGGECLAPFESAWQENYTVVDCGTAHPAQLVLRGQFEDSTGTAYPGFEALATRVGTLCADPTVINYGVAGSAQDIQISASFAVDSAEWDSGNRTFFCFVNRSTGADLPGSIAQPQPTS